jgi:hypothetical protein
MKNIFQARLRIAEMTAAHHKGSRLDPHVTVSQQSQKRGLIFHAPQNLGDSWVPGRDDSRDDFFRCRFFDAVVPN